MQVLAKLAIVAEQAPPWMEGEKEETLAKYVKIFLKWFADAQETAAPGDWNKKEKKRDGAVSRNLRWNDWGRGRGTCVTLYPRL